jgi:hypothetical protein
MYVISRSTTEQPSESCSVSRPPIDHPEYPCPCEILILPTSLARITPLDSHDRCSDSCAAPVSCFSYQDGFVHTPNASTHGRTSDCFHRADTASVCASPGTMAIGPIRSSYRIDPAPPITPKRRSGVILSTNLQYVSHNLTGAENTFQQSRGLIACTPGQVQDTPAGCSKNPDFSPSQPRRAKTRRSAGKAAASYHVLRGGWDDPNCARPTRAFRGRALREHGDCPSYPAPFFSILLKHTSFCPFSP